MQPTTLEPYKMHAKTRRGRAQERAVERFDFAHFSNAIPVPETEDVNPEVTFMEPGVTSEGIPPKRISYNAPPWLYFLNRPRRRCHADARTAGKDEMPPRNHEKKESAERKDCLGNLHQQISSRLHLFLFSW